MRVVAHGARPPRPRPGLVEHFPVPAPVQGMDSVSSAAQLDANHSLFAINVAAGDRGLKPRPGTIEHATHVGTTDGDVRSILAYHGSLGSKDRLFANAPNGIYDTSAGGAAPTLKHTFGTSNPSSGEGESLKFVNFATDHFLLYTDETNGYLLYTESTDTWAAGSTTGVAAANLVFVMQWNARVWFVERDSTRSWFLAPGAISGTATMFDWGPFFTSGGTLRGLWRWTRDGGAGMNDLLVGVSSMGDVVVFQGTDPLYPNFVLVGAWNVGGVPAGRRLARPTGGDLQLLTLNGLLPLSRLVTGQLLSPDTYETRYIRPLFTEAMSRMSASKGWHVADHPRGAFLLVNTPGVPGEPQEQFVMSYATRGWSRFRGYDMLSSAVWEGEFYFGTRDGRVLRSTGFVDNVLLGGVVTNARSVECSVLGGFSNLGSNSRKFVRFYRPIFLTKNLFPSYEATVRFDYDISEPSGALPAQTGGPGSWDASTWDVDTWNGLGGQVFRRIGVRGCGTALAFGVHFQSSDYCVLVGFDVGIEVGGPL